MKTLLQKIGAGVLYWLKQNAISLDQNINTFFFFGSADETISARCWRLRHCIGWGQAQRCIDWLLWRIDPNHCEESYKSELRGAQLPIEYQSQDIAQD